MPSIRHALPLLALLVLGACAHHPPGASMTEEPGPVAAKLDSMAAAASARTPAEFREASRQGLEELVQARVAERALHRGASAPTFVLQDAHGRQVSSDAILAQGPMVLVFYRGAWCPYCNLYLRELEKRVGDFRARGASLVAISVEPPDRSMSVEEKNALTFTVLSDPGLRVARQFGIVYELPKVTNDAYVGRGFDLAKYNGLEKSELPLSATYVIGRDGRIAYAFLDPDYKHRAEPDAILKVLSDKRLAR
jgi:peroxiredoxin